MNLRAMTYVKPTQLINKHILQYTIVENTWMSNNNHEHGWGNGYVDLPPDHPMYGKDYDDMPVRIHGGLTFAEKQEDGMWRVGFDTVHAGDTLGKWPKEEVEKETRYLVEQLEELW